MLEDVDIERAGFVNFSQKVLEILNKLGDIWGQWGQFMGQEKGLISLTPHTRLLGPSNS